MEEKDKLLFEEKQYIGYNKWAILWRTVLAMFCFLLYYWSEHPKALEVAVVGEIPSSPVGEDSGQLFFLMGLIIMILSLILIFVLHIHTKVIGNSLIIDGLWTSRKVKIDLNSIVLVKKVKYSKYLLNRPVYNLHFKNTIRFFTQGNYAIELTDKDGLKYKIGSQRPEELKAVLYHIISKNKN
ncbi:MAG: hypothetical protein A3F72_16830 [Bacteroidetes bacterium RIFCSPLOWO2_12_FULL_35_15]|nr:MAG: hypothetical protein A3F72_16830 [Bacteroidetes bacterium RIFCSPLOWO2_12_FULL_35_15]